MKHIKKITKLSKKIRRELKKLNEDILACAVSEQKAKPMYKTRIAEYMKNIEQWSGTLTKKNKFKDAPSFVEFIYSDSITISKKEYSIVEEMKKRQEEENKATKAGLNHRTTINGVGQLSLPAVTTGTTPPIVFSTAKKKMKLEDAFKWYVKEEIV